MDNDEKTTDSVNIDVYRKLVQTYLSLNLYSTALFWADKVATLSNETPKDIYWLAHCMFLQKQYHRAAHIIRSRELEKNYIQCNYLVVKCLYEAHEYTEALRVLNSMRTGILSTSISAMETNNIENEGFFDDSPRNQVHSAMLLLKGHLLEATDNRGLASECYRQALHYDVHCYEAYESLIQHQMLTASEERELLDSMPISSQCNKTEEAVLRILYESKLKKYHTIETPKSILHANLNVTFPEIILSVPAVTPISSNLNTASTPISDNRWPDSPEESGTELVSKLQESLDLVVSGAERLYYNCEYRKCKLVTEEVLKKDPYHNGCLPVHIACLVELKESNSLFSLAHKLVDLYPNLAISWFAVGCYYYVIGKSDPARRYLSKATSLDRLFGPAWLAYGHSFAVENEHDQAMAAYFKASQLMKGCHLPLLYIGLECGLTNNIRLADKFFQQAQSIAPDDPFVMHEMGVIAFQNTEFKAAEKHFKDAYNRIKSTQDSYMVEKWEPLLNNLGHTCRKLKKYEESLKYHHQALVLSPQNPSTYSAIGYTNSLMGRTREAVDWFHRALGLRRDDTFSTTMLNYVIEQLVDDVPAFAGCPDFIPDFIPSSSDKMAQDDSALNSTDANERTGDGTNLQAEDIADSDMTLSFEIEKS